MCEEDEEESANGSVFELYKELLHTDRAFDRALVRRDRYESIRLGEILRAVSLDLAFAQPETMREVHIVLRNVASSIAATDDPMGDELVPEMRRIASAARRGAVTVEDVKWLRAAAVLSNSVYNGGGLCLYPAPQILAAAECIGRPRPVG